MKKFIEYVLQFGNLSKQQTDLIKSKATEIELRKDDYFSEAGKIPRQVGFVVDGVVRGCYYNKKGEEITRCFIPENNLVVDYVNFEANLASAEYLQASTNCKVIVFSKQDWAELSHTIVGWDNIKNKMVQKCLYQKSRKNPCNFTKRHYTLSGVFGKLSDTYQSCCSFSHRIVLRCYTTIVKQNQEKYSLGLLKFQRFSTRNYYIDHMMFIRPL